jgi:hypothetical protein
MTVFKKIFQKSETIYIFDANKTNMKLLFNLLFLLTLSNVTAQIKISGKIIDSEDRTALPFVHVSVEAAEEKNGSVSDIDGNFIISVSDTAKQLKFSYVGYETAILSIDALKLDSNNLIKLSQNSYSTETVIIIAGENPAYAIIRKASKKRKANNPENYDAFKYSSYSKAIVFDEKNAPIITEPNKNSGADFYYMLMESLTERFYKKPDKDFEKILATRVSGFKNPAFAPLATAFQPFSFYSDLITVLDKDFINPISPGSIGPYEFRLEDTLYSNEKDSSFVISFFPKKENSFKMLKGVIYINSNNWAVEYVMAEPAVKTLLDLRFEQKYALINNKYWFPVQLNFELSMKPYNKVQFTLQGKSYLRDIVINPENIKNKDFGSLSVEMIPEAMSRSSEYWNNSRADCFSTKEENTYRVIDSLGLALNLDALGQFSQDLPQGLVPIGKISLDISKMIDYNPFEKLRLGLGIYTSSKFSKKIKLGGYFGYGFGDKAWKYGGDLQWNISNKKDILFQIDYKNDVAEPAPIFEKTNYLSQKVNPAESFARSYLLPRLDYNEKIEASFHFRLFRNLQLRPYAIYRKIDPAYDYLFSVSENQFLDNYRDFNSGIQLRWSFKEKFADFNGQRTLIESRYPVFYLTYSRGIAWNGISDFNYNKFLFGFELRKHFRKIGKTALNILAGYTDKALPYTMLFNGRGSYQNGIGVYNRNSFQTMQVNEFISDRFVYAFLAHNFGRFRIKSEIFRPELIICQSIGLGSLSNPLQHINIDFKTMEKGYFESGMLIDNLICYKSSNLFYLGIGLGVFMKYGPYAEPDLINNIAVNINLSLSF